MSKINNTTTSVNMPMDIKIKRWKLIALLGLIPIIFLYLWYSGKNYDIYPPAEGNTCTIFLIDGLDNSIFREELENERLPVIRGLIEKGMYIKNGISSFPTMTGYGFYPFITGYDAVKSGILGLRWFDRQRTVGNLRNYVGRTNIHMNSDLTDSIQNYFEKSGNYYTASVNTFMNKGVKHDVKTGWSHTTAKYEGKSFFKWLRAIPFAGMHLAKDHFEQESYAMEIALEQLKRNPKVHWITFPSPDAYNHVFGTDDRYKALIRHVDSLIGIYLDNVQKLRQADKRLIAIVSDHGISDVHKNIDFCGWAKKELNLNIARGRSVNFWSSSLTEKLSDLHETDGYFVINGNLTAYLYMKDRSRPETEHWKYPLQSRQILNYETKGSTINLAKKIAELEGIELVIYNNGNGEIRVLNNKSEAKINKTGEKLMYNIEKGNPLNYPEQLINVALTKEEWLENTADLEFPYAVPRLYGLLQSKGIGDIVMTSEKGYDLANDYEIFVGNYKGGHGGLRKEIINVPFVLYHPGIVPQTIQALTNEHLGLLIGQYLGFRHNSSTDNLVKNAECQ